MESAVYFFAVKNCCPEDDRAAYMKNLVSTGSVN